MQVRTEDGDGEQRYQRTAEQPELRGKATHCGPFLPEQPHDEEIRRKEEEQLVRQRGRGAERTGRHTSPPALRCGHPPGVERDDHHEQNIFASDDGRVVEREEQPGRGEEKCEKPDVQALAPHEEEEELFPEEEDAEITEMLVREEDLEIPDVVVTAIYLGNDFTDNIATAFRAAKALGISRKGLYLKRQRLGL